MSRKTVLNISIGLITAITILSVSLPELQAADEIKLGVLSTAGDH